MLDLTTEQQMFLHQFICNNINQKPLKRIDQIFLQKLLEFMF